MTSSFRVVTSCTSASLRIDNRFLPAKYAKRSVVSLNAFLPRALSKIYAVKLPGAVTLGGAAMAASLANANTKPSAAGESASRGWNAALVMCKNFHDGMINDKLYFYAPKSRRVSSLLVHSQVTIIFVVSVCLFVCAEFFSAVFDPIWIKLGHMLHVRV